MRSKRICTVLASIVFSVGCVREKTAMSVSDVEKKYARELDVISQYASNYYDYNAYISRWNYSWSKELFEKGGVLKIRFSTSDNSVGESICRDRISSWSAHFFQSDTAVDGSRVDDGTAVLLDGTRIDIMCYRKRYIVGDKWIVVSVIIPAD